MRLIDADTAFGVLADYYHHTMPIQYMALKEALDRVPNVEAVPVIRCKDCRYMRIEGDLTHWYYCEQTNCDTDSWGYCHRAERRTDETD